jgi:hypothetical protein
METNWVLIMHEDIATKNDCLYALQEGGLDLREAHMIYDHFFNKGINWLMLEFILTIQKEEPDRFQSVVCDLEDITK